MPETTVYTLRGQAGIDDAIRRILATKPCRNAQPFAFGAKMRAAFLAGYGRSSAFAALRQYGPFRFYAGRRHIGF